MLAKKDEGIDPALYDETPLVRSPLRDKGDKNVTRVKEENKAKIRQQGGKEQDK